MKVIFTKHGTGPYTIHQYKNDFVLVSHRGPVIHIVNSSEIGLLEELMEKIGEFKVKEYSENNTAYQSILEELNKQQIVQYDSETKLSHSETVTEIDWLLENYPGQGHRSLHDLDSQYGLRTRCVYNSIEATAGLVVARCIGGMMVEYGFTFRKLKEHWNSTVGLAGDVRLQSLKTVKWRDESEIVSQKD